MHTLLLYSNEHSTFSAEVAPTVPICAPHYTTSLDFAAGPAGLRSSHVTVLNNLAKLSSPDSLKALKVNSCSHLIPVSTCLFLMAPRHLKLLD